MIDTFVGGGAGAIIGDAIFPGLGTVGGAILGGIGGHNYAQRKKHGGRRREGSRSRGGFDSDDDYDSEEERRRRR